MAGSTIGIKIADGSYYPVIEGDFTGTKRLTLTTVKDGQDRVQIDLYRGEGHTLARAAYVGSLTIENISPAPQGEPEIELILGIDAGGELTAEASDRSTGESQVFTAGIRRLAESETYEEPEFEVEPEPAEPEAGGDAETGGGPERDAAAADRGTFDEVPLTGDAYPVSGADRRRAALHHGAPAARSARPARPAVTVVLVVLAVALLAALGYFVYRLVCGPPIPPLWSSTTTDSTATTDAATEPSSGGTSAGAAASGAAATTSTGGSTAAESASTTAGSASTTTASASTGSGSADTSSASGTGVTYRIKRGDTLWDIASTYYRNPWLYPVIAKANGIPNPDLIIAGARLFIPER